jgi:hypothetical protein
MKLSSSLKNIIKMKLSGLCTATFLLLLFSNCKHECDLPDPIPEKGHLQFDQMEIGQKSRYIGLDGKNYDSIDNTNFAYNDDTLQLEIIDQDTNGFLIEETLKYQGSVSNFLGYQKDSIYQYYLKLTNDTLRILPIEGDYVKSRIFEYQISQTGLPMADYPGPKIEISGWKTSFHYCECLRTAFVEAYNLFGQNYPRLNVIVQNSPMAYDGSGQTYVYSKGNGIVRFSTYSWWSQSGIGWDLLP